MRTAVLLLAAIALLAASGRFGFTLPGTEVPQTAQTLALILIASLAGAAGGPVAAAGYLLLGASGAPLFADGASGAASLSGPSGGFLVGFVPAAALCGWCSNRLTAASAPPDRYLQRFLQWTLVGLATHAVVLLCGWAWLTRLLGPGAAFATGVAPFLAGALAKSLAAAAVLGAIAQRARAAARVTRVPTRDPA